MHEEIYKWTNSLPNWQNDLIRRLYERSELIPEDESEVIENLLFDVGLPNKTQYIKNLRYDQIPNKRSDNSVKLKSLNSFENIAAIDPNHGLDFNTDGLTVIYGGNSAGKSSYAKVLKQACRAVDNSTKIHPNIFNGKGHPGTAKIHILDEDGKDRVIPRKVNTPPESLISHISIFDSECAKVYTESENNVVFIPSEFEIFNKIASAQNKLKEHIKQEKEELYKSTPDMSQFRQDTKIKRFIRSISNKTTYEKVKSECNFSTDDEKKLSQLEEDIKMLSLSNPDQFVRDLDRNVKDLFSLRTKIEEISKVLNEERVTEFLKKQLKYMDVIETLKVASKEAFDDQPLKGVGSNPWMNLWNAAKNFHATAYPTEPYPYTSEGAKCLLCQQDLAVDAKERLKNFNEFIQNTFSKEKDQLSSQIREYTGNLKKLPIESIKKASIREDLYRQNSSIEVKLELYLQSVSTLVSELLKVENEKVPRYIKLSENPLDDIDVWIETQQVELARRKEIAKSDNRDELKRKRDELQAKKDANSVIKDIYKLVEIKTYESMYDQAISLLSTNQITRKYNEISSSFISNNFKEQIENELNYLRCDNILFNLKRRGVKGQSTIKLTIDTELKADIKEILSEGEQKALSLAFFFAEVSSMENNGGIILDDPVSSFDQGRREYVAQRLIEESKKRQVIIFTHDIVFLHTLQKLGKLKNASVTCSVVRRSGKKAGIISKDFPWVAQPIKKRISFLKQELQNIKSNEEEVNTENQYYFEVKAWYSLLREGWERAVEELMFGGVIERFDASVKTQNLKDAMITEELVSLVQEGMTKASTMVHDESPAIGRMVPTIDEMRNDLSQLEFFKKKFH